MNFREEFLKENNINWENAQGEPDIDYVIWLESRLDVEKQRAYDYEKLLRITWTLLDSHYDAKLIADISNTFQKHKVVDK